MQYNNHSDSQDIVSMIGDATGIDTTNELKQITRAANEANRQIWSWIFDAYGGWVYDDGNNSDLPTSTTTLTADQQQYTLPVEALTVRAVEVKDEGGVWHVLTPTTEELIRQVQAEAEFNKTSGQPNFYVPYDRLVKLYPPPNYTQAASLRLSFDRGSVQFDSTDISQTPGFASEFHGAIPAGASYFIAKNKKLSNISTLREDWFLYEGKIKQFYQKRYQNMFPPKVHVSDYANEMM